MRCAKKSRITVKSGGEGKKVSTISGFARYCRNTRRHCELLHFRGYRKAQRNHAKVWQSTAYRKPRIAPNRLIDRAVERICNSFIIGRSPRIFMQHHQAMLRLKMKILGMTWCVYEGICDLHKFPHKHFSPPKFAGDPLFPLKIRVLPKKNGLNSCILSKKVVILPKDYSSTPPSPKESKR